MSCPASAAPTHPAAIGPRSRPVSELRRLIRKRSRSDARVVLEGARTVAEALAAGFDLLQVAVPERAVSARASPTRHRASGAVGAMLTEVDSNVELDSDVEVIVIADEAFDSVAPSVTPQPMLAVIERPRPSIPDSLASHDLVLVTVDVADPGNVGTIVRCAEACAARCVVTVGGADPWAPKAVRASAGSALRVPVVAADYAVEALRALRAAGARIIGTDVSRGMAHDSGVLAADAGPVAVVVGSEARGLDHDLRGEVDDWVCIPMANGVESLNVAMATTLLAFEFRRGSHRRSP